MWLQKAYVGTRYCNLAGWWCASQLNKAARCRNDDARAGSQLQPAGTQFNNSLSSATGSRLASLNSPAVNLYRCSAVVSRLTAWFPGHGTLSNTLVSRCRLQPPFRRQQLAAARHPQAAAPVVDGRRLRTSQPTEASSFGVTVRQPDTSCRTQSLARGRSPVRGTMATDGPLPVPKPVPRDT
jgi:hypothetical protein